MTKKILVIVGGVVVVGIVGGGVLLWQAYTGSDVYIQDKIIEEWQRRYMEDTVGGETPEETLELFIAALERGDTDHAAEYFVVDDQEAWKKDLRGIKDKGLLNDMLRDLKRPKDGRPIYEGNDDSYYYYIYNDDSELSVIISLVKIPNGTWKIESL